jgi:Protein of unknown function (DUF2975)
MTSITRDPLLAIAKGILWFLMGCMLIAAVACASAIPLMYAFQGTLSIELAKEAPQLTLTDILGWITGILLCVVALVLILFRIFQLLKRIVDTVGQGDAFLPINAARLTQMAWLTLGVQLASFAISGLVEWIENMTQLPPDVHKDIHIDGGLSGNGLLLMLILFILARVFRQGAAMRAELEGTV